jgi:hypothetical protein
MGLGMWVERLRDEGGRVCRQGVVAVLGTVYYHIVCQ